MSTAPDTGRTADLYAKLMAKRDEAAGFADERADASKGPAGSVEREHRARAGAFAEAAEMAKVADAEVTRLRAQIAVMKRARRHADNRIIAQRWNLRQLEARFSAPGSPAYAKLFQFAQRKAAEAREVRSLLNNASSEIDIPMPNDRSPPLQDLPEELVTAIKALSVAAEEFGGQTWIAAGDGAAVIRAQATLTAAILSHLREADVGRKAAEAEAAHLRAENANLRDRVREAEKDGERRGEETMCEAAAMVCDTLAEGADEALIKAEPGEAERWQAAKHCAEELAAAIRSLAAKSAPLPDTDTGGKGA